MGQLMQPGIGLGHIPAASVMEEIVSIRILDSGSLQHHWTLCSNCAEMHSTLNAGRTTRHRNSFVSYTCLDAGIH